DAIRLYFLSSHYRSPLSYSDEGCDSMERSADRLRNVLREQVDSDGAPMDPAPFQEQFIQGMDDDLNTPKALAAMFDLSHEINRQRDAGNSISAAQDCLRHLGSLLGLTFQERYVSLNLDAGLYNAMVKDIHSKLLATGQAELSELFGETPATNVDTVSGPDIDRLVHIRTECRTYKLYALADEIRNWLESQGVSVEDSAAGSIWSYRPGP
ncbi:MAG: DALR domain-containing protein, partial [Chloroflexota bacterium]|nr:DALR domain-containing protein [Chloroflexota bacterium]